jgi:hypothetical protein
MQDKPKQLQVSPLFTGVLGGGCARPGKANLRLIRRAIREDWDMPEEKRFALMQHLCGILKSRNARNCIAATCCIIEAEKANMREEDKHRKRT